MSDNAYELWKKHAAVWARHKRSPSDAEWEARDRAYESTRKSTRVEHIAATVKPTRLERIVTTTRNLAEDILERVEKRWDQAMDVIHARPIRDPNLEARTPYEANLRPELLVKLAAQQEENHTPTQKERAIRAIERKDENISEDHFIRRFDRGYDETHPLPINDWHSSQPGAEQRRQQMEYLASAAHLRIASQQTGYQSLRELAKDDLAAAREIRIHGTRHAQYLAHRLSTEQRETQNALGGGEQFVAQARERPDYQLRHPGPGEIAERRADLASDATVDKSQISKIIRQENKTMSHETQHNRQRESMAWTKVEEIGRQAVAADRMAQTQTQTQAQTQASKSKADEDLDKAKPRQSQTP